MLNFSDKKKRILFVGMPDMALCCLKALHDSKFNIVGVVPPPKNHATYNMLTDYAKSFGDEVYSYEKSINEPEFIEKIKVLNCDIAVVCSYNKLFSKEFLSTTKDGFINCHPSILPDYRGPNPYANVIYNNEKITGVTLHFMDENFDTGNIISQVGIELHPKETMGTLFSKLNDLTSTMLVETLNKYEKDGFLNSKEQKNLPCLHYAMNFDENNGRLFIRWNNDAKKIECLVRALNPFIVATTFLKGVMVKVFDVDYIDENSDKPAGTIISLENGIKVACKTGCINITGLQLGSYFIGNYKFLIDMFHVKEGDKFEG